MYNILMQEPVYHNFSITKQTYRSKQFGIKYLKHHSKKKYVA